MFPCQASGLESEKDFFYLDEGPELSKEKNNSVCLIGCDLSFRIFKTLYGFEPEFLNFCPKKRALEMKSTIPILTKCCEIKEGCELIENIVVVPWGATQKDVEEGLRKLLNTL